MGIFDFFKKNKNIDNENGLNEVYSDNGNGVLEERFYKKSGVKDGIYECYYKNGQLNIESNWKDGKEDGLYKSYHENGQLKQEGNFKDGKMSGLFKFYLENGQLEAESNFKNDKKNGLTKFYNENGQLKQEGNWIDDKQNGLSKNYYKSGKMLEESNWKDGKRNGMFLSYYENGQLEWEGNFKYDKEVGLWKKYKEDGQLEWEENKEEVPVKETQEEYTLLDYTGLDGIERYLNERVNIARIFDELNLLLFKGETVKNYLNNKSFIKDSEQKRIVKQGFTEIGLLLETLDEGVNTLSRIEPQMKETFKEKFGSSKPFPEGLDIVLIALHPEIKTVLKEGVSILD
jgi:antitoxin component YwqK of YwqJK toxin-antitoxin module